MSEQPTQAESAPEASSEQTPSVKVENGDSHEDNELANGAAVKEEESKPAESSESGDATPAEGSLINATEDNELKMFVGGLSWETETSGLREYFSKFGDVKDVTIKKDSRSERSRGFGFVLFADKESVTKVIKQSNHFLDGRKIDPKPAQALRKDGKLFAGGISPDTDNDKIKEHFSSFGEIEVFERPVDKASKKNRGFCFVTFKKDGVLKLACAERKQQLDGHEIEVKEAQIQTDRNQQRGGGFGRGGGGFGMRGGWGPQMGPYGGGFGYGGFDGGYGGFGGFNSYGGGGFGGGYGNYGGYGAQGGYGGGKTTKGRGTSGRQVGEEWGGQTHSSHTNWQRHRGQFHGAYQVYHDY